MNPAKRIFDNTCKEIDTSRHKLGYNGLNLYIWWIMKRYFYYATRALANGYPMHVPHTCKISLNSGPPEIMSKAQKKRFLYSPLIFDHMFHVVFTGKNFNNKYVHFLPDENFKDMIMKNIESDTVYQLIKK